MGKSAFSGVTVQHKGCETRARRDPVLWWLDYEAGRNKCHIWQCVMQYRYVGNQLQGFVIHHSAPAGSRGRRRGGGSGGGGGLRSLEYSW